MSATTDVAVRPPDAPITHGEIETIFRLADGLSKSGFFKDAKQGTQAFAKLIFGRDLGLSATQAMTDIHIVEGKPEMSANLQASKVRASAGYDYRILAHSDQECAIEFGPAPAPGKDDAGRWLPWPRSYGVSTFTIRDAARAGLAGKNNWKSYPRNMLFARAMSNGVAWFCPDLTNGIRVYAEGEVRETLAAAPEPPQPEPQAQQPDPAANDARTEALAKGVNIAGWDDTRLGMELVGLGVLDASDPLGALSTLTDEQAEALEQKLNAAADADAAGDGGEDGGDER